MIGTKRRIGDQSTVISAARMRPSTLCCATTVYSEELWQKLCSAKFQAQCRKLQQSWCQEVMGCFESRTSVPEAAGKVHDVGRAVPKPTEGVMDDDLDWITGDKSPVTPARALATSERNAGYLADAPLDVVVQIELEGGWRDCSTEETRAICQHLAKGETAFQIHARGQNYYIDFSRPDEGGIQANVSTGKKRKLRILDKEEDEPVAEEDGVGSADPSSASAAASPEVSLQRSYGPQSKRGGASMHPYRVLEGNDHAKKCFAQFEANEARLCGEWAVFYHSYSFAALIYEVHAAVGSVLFRFRSQYATLPRILVHEFKETPDAATLKKRFNEEFATNKRDHHPDFRRVGLSVMCSLASTGPEACVAMVFIAGYSCKDLSFRGVLENLLESCYVPKAKVRKLADEIIAMSEKHGLDVSQFGGKACHSGKPGHLMQLFIKRHLVDKLVYAAKPYGPVDDERMPISKWMDSNSSTQIGQARVLAHPKYFMQANCVRMFVASADPTFHRNRQEFQNELIQKLSLILGEPSLRERAATGIYGGTLPSWWTAEDQRKHA
ncbi:hypothetical protein AK812_SmicGene29639 [Symbiodinium microadriaticum]|uniref:WWE domain-containing protein n=2 Tax=Symbiodinium TaxID=2949 RepID=A0A1Q9D189_SYMMI|nr:hypothetical protein AK812_SmicGene29639 [Symbiodinium microadriaticum]